MCTFQMQHLLFLKLYRGNEKNMSFPPISKSQILWTDQKVIGIQHTPLMSDLCEYALQ